MDAALVVALLPDVGDGAQADAGADAEEADADADGVEAVALAEDESEGGVEEEAQAVEVAVVQGGEHDDGFGGQESERSCERDGEEVLHAPLLEMLGDVDVAGVVELAGLLCAAGKEDAVARLAAEE